MAEHVSRSGGEPQPDAIFRILYVHTDSATASTIGSTLEAEVTGISVRAVDSVEDVLSSIDDVECIVSALELGETTGIDLCSRVREIRPDVGFYLHAEGLTKELVEEAFAAGVTDCVERGGGVSLLGRRLSRYVSPEWSTVASDAGLTAEIPAELFDSVVSTCPIGVMVFDADGELVLSNDQTEATLGRSREAMAGLSFDADEWDIRDESSDPIPSERLPVNRVLEHDERVRDVTLTVARSDGTRAYISINAAPVERAGETVGAICTVQDVTDHRRIESELDELLGRVTDAFYGIDDEWRFTYLNERAHELINPEGNELVGKNIWEEYPEAIESSIYEAYHEALETQEPVAFEVYYEPLERWFLLRVSPSETGLSVYFQDVTDRKQLESELAEVYGRVKDAFVSLDPDGRVTYANDRAVEMIGLSRERLLGNAIWELLPEAFTETFYDDFEEAMERQEPIERERYYPPSDTWYEGRGYPSETGLSVYFRDVTERKRTEQELERQVRQEEVLATFGRRALSGTDIEALLNRAAQLVTETLDLSGCEILERLPDENVLLVRTDSGAPERAGEEIPIDESAVSHLREEAPLIVTDLTDWHHCPEVDRSLERDIESGVCVSIGHPDRPWGLLTGYDDETRTFTDHDVTFIRNISTILATAIERTDRESQLHRLNELTRALVQSETSGTVAEAAVEAVERAIDRTVAAIYLYDDDHGDIVVRSGVECANELEERSGIDVDDVIWQSFVESERVFIGPASDAEAASEFDADATSESEADATGESEADESNEAGGVAIPLGTHGVLLVAGIVGFDSTELDLLELLAANVRSVLDRSVREQRLRKREEALSERNELLDRANWLNDIIRSIDRALVDATTREEIEHAVCVELSGAGPYRFAWFGTYRSPTGTITPRAWAGCGGLDALEEGDVIDQRPAIDAAKLREPQIVDNLLSDPPFEPWRKEAITRGYRSCIALPVVFRDSLYGVLSLYADEVEAFSSVERSVFSELGETIAYAINAVESKRALVGDRIVELAFRISDPDIEPIALATSTGGSVEIVGIVPRTDGRLRVFAAVDGTSLEAIELWGERSVLVESVASVTERDDGYRVEWTATDESFIATLVDHGAVPRHLSVEDGDARVVVELPRHADVRTFAEMLKTRYDSAEILSRRDRERSVGSGNSFRSALERELTDRQLEVLRTAYFGGYFESPRENTGREIAAMLDISQPTFTTHLRTASRKLFELLFREEEADG